MAYLGVSLLHALWDSMHSIALVVTLLLTGSPAQYRSLEMGWMPTPTDEQVQLFTVLSWAGLAVIAIIGVSRLAALWRSTRRPYTTPPGWRVPVTRGEHGWP